MLEIWGCFLEFTSFEEGSHLALLSPALPIGAPEPAVVLLGHVVLGIELEA